MWLSLFTDSFSVSILETSCGIMLLICSRELSPVCGNALLILEEIELMFVVTNHVLVPLHEKLTQAEEDELMKRIMSTKDKLPVLLHSDPVSRFLGFLPGDVIRITRRTSYSPKYFSYRIVKKMTTS